MTFKMSMLVTADAKQAKAEMAALAGEQKKVTTSATGMGAATQTAATGLKAVEGGAKGAVSGLGTLAQAEAKAIAGAVGLGQAGARGLGPLAGLARSVGASLFSIFNPITLITTAVVSAGSGMVAWLMSGQSEAEVLKEKFETLRSAVDDFVASSQAAGAPADQMTAKYGSLTAAAREALDAVNAVNQAKAQAAPGETSKALVDSLTISFYNYAKARQDSVLSDYFGMDLAAGQRLLGTLQKLEAAQGLKAQATAALEVMAALDGANLSAEQMSGPLGDAYSQLSDIVLAAGETQGAIEASTTSIWDFVDGAAAGASGLADMVGQAQSLAGAAAAAAQNIWSTMSGMAEARVALGKTIGSGRGTSPGGPDLDPFGFRGQLERDAARIPRISTQGGGGGGGGAASARAEANAIDTLIAKQEQELAILRETDPVQKELIRMREDLAGATDAQRAKVVELTTAIEAEKVAAEAAAKSGEFLGQTLGDALISIGMNGGDATEAIENLKSALLQASLQALILGEGPLAGLFGTAGSSIFGSLFGGGAAVPALASGGMIRGPGTGTSDDVLMYGSNGEFVVNAAATAKHRALLEAINDGGGVPAFARGGMVRSGSRSGGGGGGRSAAGPVINITVNGARGNNEIREMVSEGVAQGLRSYDREVLPLRIRSVGAGNRRIG